jgi:ElaB/YqjD/DUF883 family membrane-anchored ribosome-binding protein
MNNATTPPPGSRDSAKQTLVNDLSTLAANGGAIIDDVAQMSADEMSKARMRLEASLCKAKSRLLDTGTAVSEKAAHAAEATAGYVRQNPWKTLGMVAATGVIIGALLKRR